MRELTCLLVIGLITGIVGFSPDSASAQINCKRKVSTNQWSTWTPYYKACNSELKTTFAYTKGFPGSPEVNCRVDNTSFNQYYNDYNCPGQSGLKIEWIHCTSLYNHRLLMDLQTIIDLPGFIDPCSFTAEYFADQPY